MKTRMDDIIGAIFEGKRHAAVDAEPSLVGQPYRPGSGTEGMAFDDKWCSHCARERGFRKGDNTALGCQILADTFVYDVDDPKYPKEWIYESDGRPCCTAFTTDPSKPLRCDKTLDLFKSR